MLKEVDLRRNAHHMHKYKYNIGKSDWFWTINLFLLHFLLDLFGKSSKPNLSGIFGRKLCAAFVTVTVESCSKSKHIIQYKYFCDNESLEHFFLISISNQEMPKLPYYIIINTDSLVTTSKNIDKPNLKSCYLHKRSLQN